MAQTLSPVPRSNDWAHATPRAVNVLVVGKDALIRDGLTLALRHTSPSVSVRTVESLHDALAIVHANATFGLVILDLSSIPGRRTEALQSLTRKIRPACMFVVFDELDASVMEVLHEGDTRGLISLRASLFDVQRALLCVLQGGIHWPDPRELERASIAGSRRPFMPAAVVETGRVLAAGLTSRQGDVLGLLMRGLSNKQICNELGLAMSTVKTHLSAVFRCLEVDSRVQAIVEAKRRGWSPET